MVHLKTWWKKKQWSASAASSNHPFVLSIHLWKQDGSMSWGSAWSRRTTASEVWTGPAAASPSAASTSPHSTSPSAVWPAWASATCQPTPTPRRSSQFASCLSEVHGIHTSVITCVKFSKTFLRFIYFIYLCIYIYYWTVTSWIKDSIVIIYMHNIV